MANQEWKVGDTCWLTEPFSNQPPAEAVVTDSVVPDQYILVRFVGSEETHAVFRRYLHRTKADADFKWLETQASNAFDEKQDAEIRFKQATKTYAEWLAKLDQHLKENPR